VALARDFSSDPQKRAQWAGFIRRMKLRDVPSLPQIVDGLREFLTAPMRAASESAHFDLGWSCRERKWRGERS
jgi:hypothetical protein